jgi:hypothetical protein
VGVDLAYITDFSGRVLEYRLNGFFVESWPDNRIGRSMDPRGLDVRPMG